MKNDMTLISFQVNRLTKLLMNVSLWMGIAHCIVMVVATMGQVF